MHHTLGKTANCQTLVSLTLARGEVPVMVALRLFIPENWTSDPERLKRAGVPVEYRTARTKPEIALAEIDRVIAAGVRFGCVLADAGYGSSAPFRHALSERGLLWAVGISRRQKVYATGVTMIFRRRKPVSLANTIFRIFASLGRDDAGQCKVAKDQLAPRYQRPAEMPLRGMSRPRRGRPKAPRIR